MKTFPAWGRFLVFFVATLTAGLVARWLPLTEGWTILAAGLIAGAIGLIFDLWDKRRASRSE